MFFPEISRVLGRYLIYLSLILLIPLAVSITYDYFLEPGVPSTWAFVKTIAICFGLAVIFLFHGRKADGILHRKESIALVAFIWFITAAMGALPFILNKTIENPLDAYFESMSALTTTGASIIYPKAYDPDTNREIVNVVSNYNFYGTVSPIRDAAGVIVKSGLDAVSKGLLFWRSFLQWLGGMGIVVLFIAVLPALSMGGKFLFEAEMPGPSKEGITPRIKETASLLWKIYLGLTILQVLLLFFINHDMSLFEAVTLSFSTISTGGFNIHTQTIADYYNVGTACVVMAFMVLGSLNFTLYFHCIKGKIYRIYEPEFFAYLFVLLCASVILALTLWQFAGSFSKALFFGSFQAISAQSSTGFAIGNYNLWPFSSQLLLLILTFLGGMSGSTSGGIKMARIYILFRSIGHKIESIFRPNAVHRLKIGKKEITNQTALSVFVFLCILMILTVLGTLFLVIDGIDPSTALGVISCTINNSGLIFGGSPAAAESCAFLPTFSKIISILWMALGRLEFFALLVLFIPSFWTRT